MSKNPKILSPRPEPRYCPSCGCKTSWQNRERSGTVETCPVCGKVLYKNSVPCVGGLVVENCRILLIRRTIEPFYGLWDIPGGFLEEGEPPEQGVAREVFEECGLTVHPEEVLGFYIDRYSEDCTTLNIYFICRVVCGEAVAGLEADRAEWFDLDKLPEEIAFWEHVEKVLIDLRAKRSRM